MKAYKAITYSGVDLTISKKVAMDGLQYFCIIRKDNKRIVARYKLLREAVWQLDNFVKYPILPL